jgi:2-amino-4-hydroxy-6-hydroxymethyldihydropteridine diphosphokinase
MTDQEYLIALGGNLPSDLGPPEKTLHAALDALAEGPVTILAVSRFFATPCFPPGAGPDYVNAALILRSDLTPARMLDLLHRIEARFGRKRLQRWGMRTLDLDLLAAGARVLPDAVTQTRWREVPVAQQIDAVPDQLILPHPRLQDRAFVLVPLADVAPDWVHPLTGQSVEQMCAALPEDLRAEVRPLPE